MHSPRLGPQEIVYQDRYQQIYRVIADFGDFTKEYFVRNSGQRAGAVLRLRALWTNGDFEPYWTFHLHREYARHHASRLDAVSPSGHTQRSSRAPHLEIIK